MSTAAEVNAYYAEIAAGKQRTPSDQEREFAKTLRQEDERPDTSMPGLASGTLHTQKV